MKSSDEILLTTPQHAAVKKALINKKGLRLTLLHNQSGSGLLNNLLTSAEKHIPFVDTISIMIMISDDIMQNDPKSSGLKELINKKIDTLISEANKKK